MPGYQQPNSELTLAEGLAEYFADNADHLDTRTYTAAAKEFFRCHDALHVVLGCDLSLVDEMVVKITSLFGTSEGLRVLRGYALPESKEIYQQLSLVLIIATTLRAVVVVPQTVWDCLRLIKRWPWDDFDAYLDEPLREIRAEFGIKVRAR